MGVLSKLKARRAARKATKTPATLTSAQQSAKQSIVSTAQQMSAAPSQATTVTKIATSTPTPVSPSPGGGTSDSTPAPPTDTTTTTVVNQSGSVTQGKVTYHGGAVVPNQGGKTANQLQAIALVEAKKQFGSEVKRGTFKATYTSKQNTQRESDRQAEAKAVQEEVKPYTSANTGRNVNSVSVYDPTYNPRPYSPDKGGFGKRLLTIPSNILENIREGSARQSSLTGAETFFGQGNVASVSGRDIVGTSQVSQKLQLTQDISKNISGIDTSIEKLSAGKVNEQNQFIGTEQEYSKLDKLYSQRETAVKNYETVSTINIGGRQRDVAEFGGLNKNIISSISSGVSLTGAAIGGGAGRATTSTLNTLGVKPSRSYNIGTGVGRGTEAFVNTGKYLIPGGGLFFATDIGGYGADVTQTKLKGEKLTKEQKKEGIWLGATAATMGILKYAPKFSGIGKGGKSLNPKTARLISAGTYGIVGGAGVGLGALSYSQTLKTTGDKSAAIGAGIGTGLSILGPVVGPKISEVSLFGKRSKKVEPTLALEESITDYTRQRATLLLKDDKGKYILGKTKGGEAISFGGKIDKGETARKATLRELKEETGLGIKDIKDFKFLDKVVTPEETHFVYTATLKKGSKINPMSDVKSIIKISPKNLFIKGSTGQSPRNPISIVTNKGRVRAYEAGLINFAETGTRPTWLSLKTKQGEYLLGTQSRYDVAPKNQLQYLKGYNEMLYAHGTPSPAVLNKGLLGKKGSFTVEGSMTKRGQAEGLYLQPPIAPGKTMPLNTNEVINVLGKERYLLSRSKGEGGLLGNKPGTFAKWGKPESKGYVGLSYLGFKSSQSTEVFMGVPRPKRTLFLFKEKPGVTSPTPKTLSGMESEVILKPGTEIVTIGKAEVFSIGGKKVYGQRTKVVKKGAEPEAAAEYQNLLKESSYNQNALYLPDPSKSYRSGGQRSSSSITISSTVQPSISSISSMSMTPSKNTSKSYNLFSSSSRGSSIVTQGSSVSSIKSKTKSIAPSGRSVGKSIPSLTRSYASIIPTPPPSYTRSPPTSTKKVPPGRPVGFYSRRKKGERKRRGTFGVQVRRGGIFRSVGAGLTAKEAKQLGQQVVSGTLAATFKVTGTGKQKLRTPVGFRTKSTKEGTLFIEKRSKRLSKRGEKIEIQQAKKRKPKRRKK